MEFRIEKAGEKDYLEIAELILKVWREMKHKEWFVADNAEYTYGCLHSGRGVAYIAVDVSDGKKAGVFMVTYPGKSEENLGRDIGLPEEDLEKVAHMDSAVVLPAYRGNRLQYRLMQTAEEELIRCGYQYLCCTIHPENSYSRNNALRQGYELLVTKEKYGGFRRDILMKRIRSGSHEQNLAPDRRLGVNI